MSRLFAFLRREPLVHFTLLATLLFLANYFWSNAEREVIRIDTATQKSLFKQRADLLLRPLSKEEREEAITSYVEDEILWHEARRRGLESTSRIRRQLVQGIRFLLLDDISPPNEEDLRTFYENDPSRFKFPPALTLDNVYFSNPESVPENLLPLLQNGSDFHKLGDFNIFIGSTIPWADQERLVQLFGPDSTRQILSINDTDWHGPISSNQGVHFLRVAKRHPERLAAFEDIKQYLEGDWMIAKQREVLDQELKTISKKYRIVIEGEE